MYKVASDRRQAGLHHGSPRDWVNGTEQLSAIDQLRQLQDGIKILEGRIQATDIKSKDRVSLGLQKFQMQQEISALRKRANLERAVKQGFEQIFIEMAREMMPAVQFKIIFAATDREFKRRSDALKTAEAVGSTA